MSAQINIEQENGNEGNGNPAPPPTENLNVNWNEVNLEHFKTPQGIVKLVQFIVGSILILVIPTPIPLSIVKFPSFLLTFFWIWIHFFRFQRVVRFSYPWHFLEFFSTAFVTLLYGVGTIITFFLLFWMEAAVFAIINTVAYATGAFFLHSELKLRFPTPRNAGADEDVDADESFEEIHVGS